MDGGFSPVGQLGQLEWNVVEPADSTSVVGTTVGNYRVLEEIGRGGMGVVYLARQLGLERHVALKALHGAANLAGGTGEALVRESRLAGSLSHPNIVTVYEYLEEAGTPFIAMEYVPRGSLRPWVGSMALAQLAGVLEDLLAGLAAVAPSGIVHRDLKPENVMVTADGHVKIADFGIAKATQRANATGSIVSSSGVTVGTPAYMAPEQALCEQVGPWTDLYSLGIMTYEHLVGQVPFRDVGTPIAMLLCHVNRPVPAPADVDERIDRELSDWVARLLVKDPAERTPSATVAWEELEEIVLGRLGPMWRREARLTETVRTRISPRRLDPAQFISQRVTVEASADTDPIFVTAPISVARTIEDPKLAAGERSAPALSRRRGRLASSRLALAAAASLLVGYGGARALDSGAGTVARRVSAGPVSVSLPAGWAPVAAHAAIPGYSFRSPIELGRTRPAGAETIMTLGITAAPSAALLPAALTPAGRAAPPREAVELGGRGFFRYRNVALAGSPGGATVFTQPTSAGVLVGTCRLPSSGGATTSAGCEQALASVRIVGGAPLPLSRSAGYMTSLNGALSSFDQQRTRAGAGLSQAPSPATQANTATRLQLASSRTASSVRSARPGPSELAISAAIVAALERMASGYGAMSAGTHRQDVRRFGEGVGIVRAASDQLQRALAQFASAG